MTDTKSLTVGLGIGALLGIILSAYSIESKYCKICSVYPQRCTTRKISKKTWQGQYLKWRILENTRINKEQK